MIQRFRSEIAREVIQSRMYVRRIKIEKLRVSRNITMEELDDEKNTIVAAMTAVY